MNGQAIEMSSCEACKKPRHSGCARMALCDAKTGKVRVAGVEGERRLCARMAALGIYPGVEMQLLCSGCVRVNGGTLSLGKDISDKIFVTPSE
ncbi:MAG: ferrous iron transport protein A [Desulfobacteraceae bacterium]|nr:ferrous iron transport protein A [Desulfobacteraceae bacterium]